MKKGDIVRVKLIVDGFGVFEWEDEIVSVMETSYIGTRCILKNAGIDIDSKKLTLINNPIPEGSRVEMWNGGSDTSGAFMGWYVEYNHVTGKHLVSSVKNKLEGRKWWDNVRSIEEDIANKILEKGDEN